MAVGAVAPGRYELDWDGRSETGREVAAGVYSCLLKAGDQSATRKMLLLR